VVYAKVRATSCSSRGTSGTRSGTRATHPAGSWGSSPAGFEHFFHKLGERMAEARAVSVAEVPDVAWLGARYRHYLQKASASCGLALRPAMVKEPTPLLHLPLPRRSSWGKHSAGLSDLPVPPRRSDERQPLVKNLG
jgi:hypothetical protein